MLHIEEKYINPQTDFGFKRLFGSEFNKEILISFLNALLAGEQNVKDVTYLNSEQLGDRMDSRRAIFDVYCENDKGEKFIVEMQNAYQEFFKDRTVFYSTYPIREQAKKGDWDYHLDSVYTIGLLNFIFEDKEEDRNTWHHEVKLMDVVKKQVFYDKLTFIYVEIPKFNKQPDELVTMFDKWMYVLKNLSNLMSRPPALQERVFTRLFEQAEIARFSSQELKLYEDSVNAYRDIVNAIKTAQKDSFAEGKAEGIAEGKAQGIAEGKAQGADEQKIKMAQVMLNAGESVEKIALHTGLDLDDISQIKAQRND